MKKKDIQQIKINRYQHPLIIVLFFVYTFGFSNDILFKYYTADHGLSHNMVDCIIKDKRGFMWFGTWNGLNRFDGYSFEVYKHNSLDSNSLSNNFIYDICEDSFGNIWVGTENGLNVYLFDQNRFVRHNTPYSDLNKISEKINVLHKDNKQQIWIGTTSGIRVIEPLNRQGDFRDITRSFDLSLCMGKNISSIEMNFKDLVWIGTDMGLYSFEMNINKIQKVRFRSAIIDNLSNNSVTTLYYNNNEILWIGLFANGLIHLNLQNNESQWYHHDPDNNKSLVHNTVRAITQNEQGNLLIGTLGGLSFFHPASNDFTSIIFEPDKKFSLNNDFINCIYSDQDGDVWIGTDRGGINKYNVFRKKFESLVSEAGNPNSLSHNTINSIYDDSEFLWIGTAGGGLNRYHSKTGHFKIYRSDPHDDAALTNDFISSIFRDRNNTLWIGTWGGGLHELKTIHQKDKFNHYFTVSTDLPTEKTLINNYISSVIEDIEGRLWIGTLGGLDVFTPENKTFYHIKYEEGAKPLDEVGCLQFDKTGNLWIGTIHGLYVIKADKNNCINIANPTIYYYTSLHNVNTSISGNYIISILLDREGIIWIGTYGNGFNRLKYINDNGTPIFERFTENDGLSNNIVYGIQQDNKDNLWLSTENGLSKFNIKDKSFKNYYFSDGLQSNQFYWSASYKNKEGKMFFGGMQGLNMFHPDSIHDNNISPRPILTGLKIYSQPVEVQQLYDGKEVLKKSVSTAERITLSYRSKEFTIEFSALHYDQPEKNRYKYMLEGFDKQWNYVDSKRRFATYSNLDGGEYIFRVFATNNDGKWSENPAQLIINIIPPFWKTWWFRIFIIFLLAIATFSYIRISLYSYKMQKIKLENKVIERTAQIEEQKEELQLMAKNLLEANLLLEKNNEQIEKQKNQVEQQNSEILEQRDKLIEMNKKVQMANQQRIHFFTNISHELKTPLTLILSPLEQLVERLDISYDMKQKLMLMHKNARRLFSLINQLMELRKVETGKLDLKASKDDLVLFITGISRSFQELSYKRNLTFQVVARPQEIIIYFDHEKIENIVYNLFSNAFKYTPEGGSVSLRITRGSSFNNDYSSYVPIVDKGTFKNAPPEDFVEISVTDTGIGIDNNHLRDVFKMFYRDPAIEGSHMHGTGIGLSLVKELVKAYRGSLYVKSEKEKGSTFCVLLPANEKYLFPEEKVESLEKTGTPEEKTLKTVNSSLSKKETIVINSSDQLLPSILIVEDNHEMRNYLTSQLQNSFKIFEAHNGKEGIDMAIMQSPDIIISDIMMPEVDGIELCTRIKSDITTSHIPVILLTSKSGVQDQIEGYDSGADDYISKPFNMSILESRIKNLLQSRENLRKQFLERGIPDPKKLTTNTVDEKFLKNAIKILNENFHQPDFTVEKFAFLLHVSRSLLHKKLVAIIGQSPIDFITSIRMKKAVSLLLNEGVNINEVAYQVGYNDPKYFSRTFKRIHGKTPTEFLKDKIK